MGLQYLKIEQKVAVLKVRLGVRECFALGDLGPSNAGKDALSNLTAE